MKKIIFSKRFKRDYKRVLKRGLDPQKLQTIIELLISDQELPERCRAHKLKGNYTGFWECHIQPDWLLIYDIHEDSVGLVGTGSHSDLFK